MKTLIRIIQFEILSLALIFLAPTAGAQSLWNTASGNWSVAGSWLPAAVPGATTNVVFTNNVGAPTSPGTIDNTVDAGFAGSISSLLFSQNTNSGGVVFYHTMQIASAQTLTVTNGLTVGTLTDAGAAATVNATITGAGGKLVVSGGNMIVNQASATG